MAETTPAVSYSADPTLYLYTSLTAGSSHIITATSRLETILKAHRIPFRALDVATDEKARMLWGRRSKGKKLPGLVQYGSIVGDLEEIEEWNEYGELKERLGVAPTPAPTRNTTTPSKAATPTTVTNPGTGPASLESQPTPVITKDVAPPTDTTATVSPKKDETPLAIAMRQAGFEAAKKAGERKASQTSKFAQDKSTEEAEVPPSATTTDIASPVEEPNITPEMTAAKVPEKLAEDGAKRTSIDKIAEEEAKRARPEEEAGVAQEGDGSEPAGMSAEAAKLEARRVSSVAKSKSPLAEETTVSEEPLAEEADEEPTSTTHRGTNVSEASGKEVEDVEDQKVDADKTETVKASVEASGEPVSKAAEENQAIEKSTVVDISVTDAGELPGTKEVDTQKQDAKESQAAGISVGD